MMTLSLVLFFANSFAAAAPADYEAFLRRYGQGSSVYFIDEEKLQASSDDGLPADVLYGSVVKKMDPRYEGTVVHWSRNWSVEVEESNSKGLLVAIMNGGVPEGWAWGAGLKAGSEAACGEKTDAAGRYLESHRGMIRAIYANPLRAVFDVDDRKFAHCWKI